MRCNHKRIKKNYPFGRNSEPSMFCLDCKKPVTKHELMKMRQQSIKEAKRRRR